MASRSFWEKLTNFWSVTEKPKDETLEASPTLEKESEQKVSRKELPEYLKQKLKARGILKHEADGGSITSENVSSICISYSSETFMFAHKKFLLLLSLKDRLYLITSCYLIFCDQCYKYVWIPEIWRSTWSNHQCPQVTAGLGQYISAIITCHIPVCK